MTSILQQMDLILYQSATSEAPVQTNRDLLRPRRCRNAEVRLKFLHAVDFVGLLTLVNNSCRLCSSPGARSITVQ